MPRSPFTRSLFTKRVRLLVIPMSMLVGFYFANAFPDQGDTTDKMTPSNDADASDPDAGLGEVIRVVDGDTIVVRINGQEEKIRLIGINTPESVDPRKPVECFGKEASKHAAELLPEGTAIRLVRDVEARDRYKRLLAYVYRKDDGLFVNLALINDGFAQPATYPPNVAHVEEFSAAAQVAREQNRGLWAACPTN